MEFSRLVYFEKKMDHLICYAFLKSGIYLKKEWLLVKRLHMNNDSGAMIVVHFIVKTWIKHEVHAMNKTFSLISVQQ